MKNTRWLTSEEQSLWRKTLQFHQLLDLAIDRQLQRDAELSAADYSVLVALSEAEGAGMRARDLGAGLKWDRSRVSHQVRRMERRGLVEKAACETDGRGTIVQLTDAGHQAIEASAPHHVAQVRDLYIDRITPAEMAMLDDVFGRVIERIRETEQMD